MGQPSSGSRSSFEPGSRRCVACLALFLLLLGALSSDPLRAALGAEESDLALAPQRPPDGAPLAPGTGYLLPEMDLSHLDGRQLPRSLAGQLLPGHWDWREQGKVSPVGDQGACGACYAFGAIGNLESKLLIDGAAHLSGEPPADPLAGAPDLSENHAKECNWRELNNFQYPAGTRHGSCDGGNTAMMASLFSQTGAVLEPCDPYLDQDVPCRSSCPYEKTVLDWRLISGGAVPDPELLKHYIYTYGPVATAMYADPGKGLDGSYDGSYTIDYTALEGAANHCVLIVGWSNNLPPVRSAAAAVGPAEGWIVKNSWGAGWGDAGYFTITYGAANIGLNSSFVHSWQDYDPSGEVWYYDDDGWWSSAGHKDGQHTTSWGLARFVPPSDTRVTAFEFWTTDATTDVDLYLYDSFDGRAPTGLLAAKPDVAFEEAGYHSVALDTPLSVSAGDEVVLVARFSNRSYGYPLAADPHGTVEAGRTYANLTPGGDAGSWIDVARNVRADLALRLRTSTGLPPAPWVTRCTPNLGQSSGAVQIDLLEGRYFRAGAGVSLVRAGYAPVIARDVQVVDAATIRCDLELAGIATGRWNLVVANPDGQEGRLAGGFVVAAPGQKVWVSAEASLPGGSSWHVAGNWLPEGVPSAADDAYVPGLMPSPVLSTADAAVDDLTLEAGAVLDLGTRGLTVEGLLTNGGTLRQTRTLVSGGSTEFLQVTNGAGTQTKYNGLEIRLDGASADRGEPLPRGLGSGGAIAIQVSISGDQRCPGRSSGVRRCYAVSSALPDRATVRFALRDAERDGLPLAELVAYGYDGQWWELPGPFVRGGSGEALFLEATIEDAYSRFTLDLPGRGTRVVDLPIVHKRWTGPVEPVATPTPSPTPDVPQPHVVDSAAFAPYAGSNSTYLVGRVTNPENERAGFVKIYSNFYDSGGSRVGGDYAYTCFPSLAPGMTSPFIDIVNVPVSSWATYTLAVEAQDLGGTPLPLAVAGQASSFDAASAFHVTGTASNPHGQRLGDNRACLAMLNSAGRTIGVWWDDLADLDPGAGDAFDVKVSFWQGRPDQDQVAGYELTAYSQYGKSLQAANAARRQEVRQQFEALHRQMELDLAHQGD